MKKRMLKIYSGLVGNGTTTGLAKVATDAQTALGIDNKIQKYEPFIMTNSTDITQVGTLTKPTQRLTIGKNANGVAKTDLQEYATLQEVSDLNTAISAIANPRYTFWTGTGDVNSVEITSPTLATNKTYYGIYTLTGSGVLTGVTFHSPSTITGQTYYLRIVNSRAVATTITLPNTTGHIHNAGTGISLAAGKHITIALITNGTNYEWQVSEQLTQYA